MSSGLEHVYIRALDKFWYYYYYYSNRTPQQSKRKTSTDSCDSNKIFLFNIVINDKCRHTKIELSEGFVLITHPRVNYLSWGIFPFSSCVSAI